MPRQSGAATDRRSGWRRLTSKLAITLAIGLASAAPASAGSVTLTFDDLPVFGPFYTPAQGEDVTTRVDKRRTKTPPEAG